MKTLVLLFGAWLAAPGAGATPPPDSLATRLSAAATDTARLRLLYDAVLRLAPQAQDSAVARQLAALAEQAGALGSRVREPEYQLLAGRAQVKALVNLKRYRRAAAVARQLQPLLPRLAQPRQRAELYVALATGAYYLSDWKAFTGHALQALRIEERRGNLPEVARLYGGLAKAAISQGEYAEGVSYTRRALAIYRRQGNRPKLAETYSDLGVLFQNLPPGQLAHALDSARAYFGRAIGTARAVGDSSLVATPAFNLAGVCWAQHQLPRAEALVRRAIAIQAAQHNYESLAIYYTGLASVHLEQRRFPAAEAQLRAAQAAAARLPVTRLGLDIEQGYADLYERAGQPARALPHLRRYVALHDSLFTRDKAQAIAALKVDYEAEQQAQQIGALQAETRAQRQRQGLLGVLALAVIGGLGFLYRGVLLQKRLARRSQQLAERDQRVTQEQNRRLVAEKALEEETTRRLQADVATRQRELLAAQVFIQQKNELLGTLQEQLQEASAAAPADTQQPLRQMSRTIRQNIRFDDDWERIKLHFEGVHPDFFRRVQAAAPTLTDHELRHCAYIKMKFATKEIAALLGIDHNSVKVARYRLKKKLNLPAEQELFAYFSQL